MSDQTETASAIGTLDKLIETSLTLCSRIITTCLYSSTLSYFESVIFTLSLRRHCDRDFGFESLNFMEKGILKIIFLFGTRISII